MVQDVSTLPTFLAGICNSIILEGNVCQGWTFDLNTNLAVFKGQPPEQAVDLTTEAKHADNSILWWLNAGMAWIYMLQCLLHVHK